jgi:predicted alpha/beta superfamily hydrolase
MTAEPVTILGSEMHVMESQHNGRTYRITISLPLGYDKSPDEAWPFNDTPEKWPVIYVLDGNWNFGLVTDIIRPMAWCGSTTDAIVVGIGYPEDSNPITTFRETMTRRDHDLTPVHDAETEKNMSEGFKRPVPNGDAAGFHKFIQEELIPFVEKTYRADPAKRILVGHSYGGLFALHSLFETPGLFSVMVMGSPTLSYAKRYMFQREETFSKAPKQVPVKIYLFMGEYEENINDTTLTDTLRLAAILEGRKYEGLSLVKHIFEDQNHCEVAAAGFQWGIKHALRK